MLRGSAGNGDFGGVGGSADDNGKKHGQQDEGPDFLSGKEGKFRPTKRDK